MKSNLLLLLFLSITFINCQPKKKEHHNFDSQSERETVSKKVDVLKFDKHLKVYEYDATYNDSTLVSELWFEKDSIVKSGATFYHAIPFESQFIRNEIIKNAKGDKKFVTFDELMCETGGTSAWNTYFFKYDDQNRPLTAEHYKAWWNEGLGDAPRPEKPQYFLGEKLTYTYEKNWYQQLAYNDKAELIETIEKRFDQKQRLIYERWDAWNRHRFKVFYAYTP